MRTFHSGGGVPENVAISDVGACGWHSRHDSACYTDLMGFSANYSGEGYIKASSDGSGCHA